MQTNYDKICKEYADEIQDYLQQKSVYDYFDENDIFNIEYRIDERRRYKNVQVMICAGGPNIYIDTRIKAVCLFWGGNTADYPLSDKICNTIDNYFETKLYEEI